MRMRLDGGLPCVTATLEYNGHTLELLNVVLDTGSVGTILSADKVAEIGLLYEQNDSIYQVRGIGGIETVFHKSVESLAIGDLVVPDMEVEIGAMDYGIAMDGIIGMSFLERIGAIIDLAHMELRGGEG